MHFRLQMTFASFASTRTQLAPKQFGSLKNYFVDQQRIKRHPSTGRLWVNLLKNSPANLGYTMESLLELDKEALMEPSTDGGTPVHSVARNFEDASFDNNVLEKINAIDPEAFIRKDK